MKKIFSKLPFVIGNLLALSVIVGSFVIPLFSPPVYAQANLGTINPPPGIPATGGNPSAFVSDLVAKGLQLLLIISFIAAFVFLILGGLKFITSGGDPKNIDAARSQITWGIIGLVVILVSYAIIRVVETFFGLTIITGTITIPTII